MSFMFLRCSLGTKRSLEMIYILSSMASTKEQRRHVALNILFYFPTFVIIFPQHEENISSYSMLVAGFVFGHPFRKQKIVWPLPISKSRFSFSPQNVSLVSHKRSENMSLSIFLLFVLHGVLSSNCHPSSQGFMKMKATYSFT